MHKEFRGVKGSPGGGGSAWEVSVEILYVYALGLAKTIFLETPHGPMQLKPGL